MSILEELRAAFDGDSVPKKNIQLRKAYDEIKRLLAALQAIADDPDTNVEAAAYARIAASRLQSKSSADAAHGQQAGPEVK